MSARRKCPTKSAPSLTAGQQATPAFSRIIKVSHPQQLSAPSRRLARAAAAYPHDKPPGTATQLDRGPAGHASRRQHPAGSPASCPQQLPAQSPRSTAAAAYQVSTIATHPQHPANRPHHRPRAISPADRGTRPPHRLKASAQTIPYRIPHRKAAQRISRRPRSWSRPCSRFLTPRARLPPRPSSSGPGGPAGPCGAGSGLRTDMSSAIRRQPSRFHCAPGRVAFTLGDSGPGAAPACGPGSAPVRPG